MSYSLDSSKCGYIAEYFGVMKGDTRSFDYMWELVRFKVRMTLHIRQDHRGESVPTESRNPRRLPKHLKPHVHLLASNGQKR